MRRDDERVFKNILNIETEEANLDIHVVDKKKLYKEALRKWKC